MSYLNKKAYTIAEMMVVLLILTIIFAAFAPLITKRATSSDKSKYAVWNAYNKNRGFDAYYYPGDTKYSASLFAGLTPDGHGTITSSLAPQSRLVIRSGSVTSSGLLQRQIQFRFGRSTTTSSDSYKYGTFAGTWLMDRKNVLLGGSYYGLNSVPDNIEARDNIGIGYESLTSITSASGNTALGTYSLYKNTSGKYNVAIGYNAGSKITTQKNNTYVGSGAGENNTGNYNTAVGYRAGAKGTGELNTFIGAGAGENAGSGSRNVAIGYKALNNITTGTYNTAIGAYALQNVTTGGYNVAIGYNACSQVTSGSHKTCIGYNSGPGTIGDSSTSTHIIPGDTTGTKTGYIDGRIDDVQRTYIGSKPKQVFGGDAVLEIHNVGGSNPNLINSPSVNSNTTTVINGNLIVRGRHMFTVGNELWNFRDVDPNGSSSEHSMGYYSNHWGDARVARDQTSSETCSSSLGVCLTSSSSDRRLKNIETKSLAGLKELNQLKIYNYTFKDDKNKLPHVGVIAQDLQKVFPNSVFTGPDGYLRIRWEEMFYASINAIKELDKKIVSLVNRTTKVETQIAQLEKENITLQNQVKLLSNRVEKLKK